MDNSFFPSPCMGDYVHLYAGRAVGASRETGRSFGLSWRRRLQALKNLRAPQKEKIQSLAASVCPARPATDLFFFPCLLLFLSSFLLLAGRLG